MIKFTAARNRTSQAENTRAENGMTKESQESTKTCELAITLLTTRISLSLRFYDLVMIFHRCLNIDQSFQVESSEHHHWRVDLHFFNLAKLLVN